MKRILIFFIILSTIDCTSQDFQFGLKGGLNLSSVWSNSKRGFYSPELKLKNSYHFGVTVDFQIRENLSLQSEIIFSRQGTIRKSGRGYVKGFDYILNLDYLNVPVIVNFKVFKNAKLQFGPQYGKFLTVVEGSKYISGSGANFDDDPITKNSDILKHDFSLILGIQYKFNRIFTQFRYNFGTTDVFAGYRRRAILNDVSDDGLKNSVFQLSIGYLILQK